ncbi:hypothetical protein PHJA_002785800 [Phtheirospermum japonicum]|uniref:Uncharacterized protein n=1 Tax=Phtheirospermum japonicum TaxID=374723 RepID=A0A830D1B5_9LAMI|nr:hypothetical protein PHJA_002785800 [Phtheirospermum japonicum]
MEAIWSLEDKLKVTTQKAIALFACTISLLVIAVCLATALTRKKSRAKAKINQEPCTNNEMLSPARMLMRAVMWSGPSKWDGQPGIQREPPTPLLVKSDNVVGDQVGWQSHNSTSAVWKKPILMGEKCELPRFSGLILYDQRGMPVHHCEEGAIVHKQGSVMEVLFVFIEKFQDLEVINSILR